MQGGTQGWVLANHGPSGASDPNPTKRRRAAGSGATGLGLAWEQSIALDRCESMDKQTKREVWLLAIGTALVELPIAFAAFTILGH
jgi:hypothetical protein